jgi:hypothetical protein
MNTLKGIKLLQEAFINQHYSPIEMGWSGDQQKKLATAFLIEFKKANEFEDIALTPREENNNFLKKYNISVNEAKKNIKTLSINEIENVFGNSYNKKENAAGYFNGDKVNYITGILIVAKKIIHTPNDGDIECYIKITVKDNLFYFF